MSTQVMHLLAKLRETAFRKNVLLTCEEVISAATAYFQGKSNDPTLDYAIDDWQAALQLGETVCFVSSLGKMFDRPFESLSSPKIIRPDELWDAFEVYLRPCSSISEETYDAFLDHVEHRLLASRKSKSFALCDLSFPEGTYKSDNIVRGLVHGILITRAEILRNVSEEEIKKSRDALFKDEAEVSLESLGCIGEFEIYFSGLRFERTERGLRRPDAEKQVTGTLQVELSGRCSECAMETLVREIKPLAESHFVSVKSLESKLTVEIFDKYRLFGMEGIRLAILNTSNKDSFDRRIANAVRLLAEADKQTSDPVGLALCVAAIDALLGRKGAEMTNKLADFAAGLLEPDVIRRRRAADYVVDLYDKRSRVLHGDRLEGNAELRDDARRLAAGVLFGVWSYKSFFERFYDTTPAPDEFFKKMREDFVKAGLPDGVLELPIKKLWQSDAT